MNKNAAESTHSRMRRAEKGVFHRISGKYLHRYAEEMAWRNDRRRRPNGELFTEVGEMALMHPVSRVWKGRWQATRPNAVVPAAPSAAETMETDICFSMRWNPFTAWNPWMKEAA